MKNNIFTFFGFENECLCQGGPFCCITLNLDRNFLWILKKTVILTSFFRNQFRAIATHLAQYFCFVQACSLYIMKHDHSIVCTRRYTHGGYTYKYRRVCLRQQRVYAADRVVRKLANHEMFQAYDRTIVKLSHDPRTHSLVVVVAPHTKIVLLTGWWVECGWVDKISYDIGEWPYDVRVSSHWEIFIIIKLNTFETVDPRWFSRNFAGWAESKFHCFSFQFLSRWAHPFICKK